MDHPHGENTHVSQLEKGKLLELGHLWPIKSMTKQLKKSYPDDAQKSQRSFYLILDGLNLQWNKAPKLPE